MAITNGYLTLAQLKDHLQSSGFPAVNKPEDINNMETAIEAMSRIIDEYAQTTFYSRTETRTYTAEWYDLLYIDDLISVTTLKTDDDADGTYETTWTSTDYWLEPKNARLNSDAGQNKPYRQIRTNNAQGSYTFPVGVEYGVQIAGTWGYTSEATPAVKQAMLLMANRVFRRKDAIFGIAGTPQLGVQVVRAKIEQDTDIQHLLRGIDMRGF